MQKIVFVLQNPTFFYQAFMRQLWEWQSAGQFKGTDLVSICSAAVKIPPYPAGTLLKGNQLFVVSQILLVSFLLFW